MSLKSWARKDLHRGDLSELSQLAKNSWVQPDPERTKRLSNRGFVASADNDTVRVTLKGHVALWVRRRLK